MSIKALFQIIFYRREMSRQFQNENIDDLVFMKQQWLLISSSPLLKEYSHKYSSDRCQVRSLSGISMKQLDYYSERQAYSFPFCPKIYKYSINHSRCVSSQMTFDIQLLIELQQNRWKSLHYEHQAIIRQKITDILQALQYISRRYGYFLLIPNMVAWTSLRVVKVWFSEDFTSNKIQLPLASESQMVENIGKLLQKQNIYKFTSRPQTFAQLTTAIKNHQNTVKFFATHSQHRHKLYFNQLQKSINSRKNITFSYSNKSIIESKQLDMSIPLHSTLDRRNNLQQHSYSNKPRPSIFINEEITRKKSSKDQQRQQIKSKTYFKPLQVRQPKSFHNKEQTFSIKNSSQTFQKTTISSLNCSDNLTLKQIDNHTHLTRSNNYHLSMDNHSKIPTYRLSEVGNSRQRHQSNKIVVKPQQQNHHQIKDTIVDKHIPLKQNRPATRVQRRNSPLNLSIPVLGDIEKDLDALFISKQSFDCGQLEEQLDLIL